MAYVPAPKDLTKIKSRVAFHLTGRQLLCFGGAGLVGIPFYLLTKGSLGADGAAMAMVVLILPFFVFALYERDGQPFEKFLRNYIETKFLRPKIRINRTENLYRYLDKTSRERKERLPVAKRGKKNRKK